MHPPARGYAIRRTVAMDCAAWYVPIVERVVRVFGSFADADAADDDDYANLTPQARLDLLLELIERHRSALGEAAERFERVHRVVELSRS